MKDEPKSLGAFLGVTISLGTSALDDEEAYMCVAK
jgi:hypothetical protein